MTAATRRYVARLLYTAAMLDGTTEAALPRLGIIADTLTDRTPVETISLDADARAAALDEMHGWAWVEHAERGHVQTTACECCGALLPPALLATCDHGFGPDDPDDPTTDQPIREVTTVLATGREQLLGRLREIHPTPDCLPVPALRIPRTRDQLDTEIQAVVASLVAPDGGTHSDWVTVWHVCDHAPGRAAVVAHELVRRWHYLLLVCRQYLDDGCATVPYNPTSAAAHLAQGIRSLSVPPRDHAIQPGQVGDLADGDEFSLDGGQTWHVCGVVLFGTVSVYTGEHDTAVGQPLLVRIAADADQSCLVRRPLTR